MITKNRVASRKRIKTHIRLEMAGTPDRPRLSVYRSLKHVYAQIVDDESGKTLVSISDISKGVRAEFQEKKGQIAIGKRVGNLVAAAASEKGIKAVVFDRNGYLYHGVVKAVADGAREGGLKF
ncbi:MAG: 50S ribosomal protein L18 [Bacteroidota bacterium]